MTTTETKTLEETITDPILGTEDSNKDATEKQQCDNLLTRKQQSSK